MEDMIKRIIEMDESVREIDRDVQKEKISSEQEIIILREKIRDEYLERARKRIDINRKSEERFAKKKIDEIKSLNQKILNRLELSYSKNVDSWVSSIVERALSE